MTQLDGVPRWRRGRRARRRIKEAVRTAWIQTVVFARPSQREQCMDAQWRIELLGGLRVSQGQRVIPPFRRPKVEVLFTYLALYCRHPQPREALILSLIHI